MRAWSAHGSPFLKVSIAAPAVSVPPSGMTTDEMDPAPKTNPATYSYSGCDFRIIRTRLARNIMDAPIDASSFRA